MNWYEVLLFGIFGFGTAGSMSTIKLPWSMSLAPYSAKPTLELTGKATHAPVMFVTMIGSGSLFGPSARSPVQELSESTLNDGLSAEMEPIRADTLLVLIVVLAHTRD